MFGFVFVLFFLTMKGKTSTNHAIHDGGRTGGEVKKGKIRKEKEGEKGTLASSKNIERKNRRENKQNLGEKFPKSVRDQIIFCFKYFMVCVGDVGCVSYDKELPFSMGCRSS